MLTCSEDDDREEAITSGGLDLIVVPGLGFTKVSVVMTTLLFLINIFCYLFQNVEKAIVNQEQSDT